ncbi:MAG: M90 family metallopeptidase, partial [Planctomycetota bacterium]
MKILVDNVPLYARLPENDQLELQRHILVFLSEKQFEGCRGLEITDEIRVTIAAQACILLLHRDTDYYPQVSSILVYPTAFTVPVKEYSDSGIVSEGREDLEGEAWGDGLIVLSWEDVRFGAADIGDGRNLVLHEFAHQLDM